MFNNSLFQPEIINLLSQLSSVVMLHPALCVSAFVLELLDIMAGDGAARGVGLSLNVMALHVWPTLSPLRLAMIYMLGQEAQALSPPGQPPVAAAPAQVPPAVLPPAAAAAPGHPGSGAGDTAS